MGKKILFILSFLPLMFPPSAYSQEETFGVIRIFSIPQNAKIKVPKLDLRTEVKDSSGILIRNVPPDKYRIKFTAKSGIIVERFEVKEDDTLNILVHFPRNMIYSATSKKLAEHFRKRRMDRMYKNLISWKKIKRVPTYNPDSGYAVNKKGEKIFHKVKQMPKFNNGIASDEFNEYLSENIRILKDSANNEIEGTVLIQFIVDESGMVKDPVIVSGANPALNREALRVVRSSPPWNPGKKRGENVKVIFTFPVIFEAERDTWN